MKRADALDGLVMVGLVLIAISIYLAWGLAAALGFVGTVLLVLGVVAAALRKPTGDQSK